MFQRIQIRRQRKKSKLKANVRTTKKFKNKHFANGTLNLSSMETPLSLPLNTLIVKFNVDSNFPLNTFSTSHGNSYLKLTKRS